MTNLPLILYNGEAKHVKFIQYPDGQANCQLDMEYFNDPKTSISIKCSIRNFNELEKLLCVVAALRANDYAIGTITFYYLFGMRSDRSFHPGMPNYFRDVLSPIINSLPGNHEYFYPHGTIVYHHFKDNSFLNYSINDDGKFLRFSGDFICIAADKSAYDELPYEFCTHFDKIRKDSDIIAVLSTENKNGLDDAVRKHPYKPFLIIDDLCDGGRTFEVVGNTLRLLYPDKPRHLFIAHGLFTKGFDNLLKVYDGIMTTNSYQPFKDVPPTVKVYEVIKP